MTDAPEGAGQTPMNRLSGHTFMMPAQPKSSQQSQSAVAVSSDSRRYGTAIKSCR